MRIFIVAVALALLITGCGGTANKEGGSAPQQDRKVRTQQTVPQKREIKDPQEVASRLAKLADSVPNVNAATCVVIGNTAIVGIDVAGDLDRSRVGTIKYSVAEALNKDPYGVNAIVTADIDINNRLREIAADIQRGQPVAGFANELADMIGRIMPQLPRDITPSEEREPNTSKDRKKLDRKTM